MIDSFVDPITRGPPGPDYAFRLADYFYDRTEPQHIFDDQFYFTLRLLNSNPLYEKMRAVVKMMFTARAIEAFSQDIDLEMVPEAITAGPDFMAMAIAHKAKVIEAYGEMAIYRLYDFLNKEQLNIYRGKNENRSMKRGNDLDALHSEDKKLLNILLPSGMEPMLIVALLVAGFTNKEFLNDQMFEGYHVPVSQISRLGKFMDNLGDSRNGNFETFTQFQTRYGIIPIRPLGDTKITTPDGQDVTPADYLAILQGYIAKATEAKDPETGEIVPIMADLSLKMAVRVMMLEEMRATGRPHVGQPGCRSWGALDQSRIDPVLRALGPDHDARFATIKDAILAYMEKHNLRWQLGDHFGLTDYDGESAYYDRYLTEMKARRPKLKQLAEVWRAEVAAINDRLDTAKALKVRGLDDYQVTKIPYAMRGEFFKAVSSLFDERTIALTKPPEKIALLISLGMIEAAQPAGRQEHKGDIMLCIDRRGGTAAARYAKDVGVLIPREARGVRPRSGKKNFDEAVKDENIRLARVATRRLKEAHPDRVVTSSEVTEQHAKNYTLNRKAIVEEGPDEFGGMAKGALNEERLRRRCSMLVTSGEWQLSAPETFMRLYARKIQLGLIERPINMPHTAMTVADYVEDENSPKCWQRKLWPTIFAK